MVQTYEKLACFGKLFLWLGGRGLIPLYLKIKSITTGTVKYTFKRAENKHYIIKFLFSFIILLETIRTHTPHKLKSQSTNHWTPNL